MKVVRPQPQHIRFTKEGYEKLKQEYEDVKKQRPAAVAELKKARGMGDLSENGYYKASRQKLNFIDGQLQRLAYALKFSDIIESSGEDIVEIGKTVTISDGKAEKTYNIVGDWEADPMNGKISLVSPIGKAIALKKTGDEVTIEIPAGTKTYRISEIK